MFKFLAPLLAAVILALSSADADAQAPLDYKAWAVRVCGQLTPIVQARLKIMKANGGADPLPTVNGVIRELSFSILAFESVSGAMTARPPMERSC